MVVEYGLYEAVQYISEAPFNLEPAVESGCQEGYSLSLIFPCSVHHNHRYYRHSWSGVYEDVRCPWVSCQPGAATECQDWSGTEGMRQCPKVRHNKEWRLIYKVGDFRQESDEVDNCESLLWVHLICLPLCSNLFLLELPSALSKASSPVRWWSVPGLDYKRVPCHGDLFQIWVGRWLGKFGDYDYVPWTHAMWFNLQLYFCLPQSH